MNSLLEQNRLLYKIAREYYENHLTQNDIANKFGLSRIKISRLLHLARENKIVTITLHAPDALTAEREEALEKRYGLEEARIIQCEETIEQREIARALAPAATDILLRRLTPDCIVGVTWGNTIQAFVDALPLKPQHNIKIVQLNGELSPIWRLENSAELSRQLAFKLSAELHVLSAPGLARTKEAADLFKNDTLIAETLRLAARANIAVLGIGMLQKSSRILLDNGLLSENDIQELDAKTAVGDIALRYINANGRPLNLALDDRIIGLTFEQLCKIPCVIAVAGGEQKHAAIRAALKTHMINVLVTDHVTAAYLLKAES
ncbi:sugar-binding transcriptional regulator [candidate division KSB1 bacterium]|nr:sugar-binding transcriptional regulator [candidate division KSB1 bacterium]